MNNNDFKYFLTLAEELNFTKAAKKLFISQQALSQRIINLENHLKVKLFKRTSPLELTDEGYYFKKHALYVLALENKVKKEIVNMSSQQNECLKLGVTHTRGALLLPKLLNKLLSNNPSLKIILKEGTTNELEQSLKRSEIDLYIGFPSLPTPSIASELLSIDEFFIIVPKKILEKNCNISVENSLAVNLKHLAGYPFIKMKSTTFAGKIFDSFCKNHNFYPEVVLETENILTMISVSLSGLGCMLCSKAFLDLTAADVNQEMLLISTEGTFGKQYIAINYEIGSYQKKVVQDAIHTIKNALED